MSYNPVFFKYLIIAGRNADYKNNSKRIGYLRQEEDADTFIKSYDSYDYIQFPNSRLIGYFK